MKPYVIIHIGMSADGRIDWGGGSDNPYYELVEQFGSDTDISGSTTMLKAFLPEEPEKAFGGMYAQWVNKPCRPLNAVVDSRGQIKRWALIKKQPWWRGWVSLCSEATPVKHLEYLKSEQIPYIIAGRERVDLQRALELLSERFDTRKVRLDCGGILNGVFLRAGLVDEVSLVINSSLVGGTTPQTMFAAPDLTSEEGVIPLKLIKVEKIRENYLWVRYQIDKINDVI